GVRSVLRGGGCAVGSVFPYRTLFRSLLGVLGDVFGAADRPGPGAVPSGPAHRAERPVGIDGQPMPDDQGEGDVEHHGGLALVIRDRKSTRLNSSQVKSSYAVFCLKLP